MSLSTESIVWINGSLNAESQARISPFDHGLTTGDGVFETMRVYAGRAFAIRRHWERLARSAEVLGLVLPEKPVVDQAIGAVIAANKIGEGRLRITVTGGPAPLGSEKGDALATVIIAASEIAPPAAFARLVTVPFRRNEHGALTSHKTTSYGENVVALAYAKQRGGTEAIFANVAGQLCEGTGSNVFVLHQGGWITPPLAAGCLPGVTRALALELAEKLGLAVGQRNLPLAALAEAREAFLTSSLREVQPVEMLDGKPLAVCPGETAQRLRRAYRELVASNLDP